MFPLLGQTQGFLNSIKRRGIPPSGGESEILLDRILVLGGRTWRGLILTIRIFFEAKNNILYKLTID